MWTSSIDYIFPITPEGVDLKKIRWRLVAGNAHLSHDGTKTTGHSGQSKLDSRLNNQRECCEHAK